MSDTSGGGSSASGDEIDLKALEAGLATVEFPRDNSFERKVRDESGVETEMMVTWLVSDKTYDSLSWDDSLLMEDSTISMLVGVTDDRRLVANNQIVTIQGALDAVEGLQRSQLIALLSGDLEEAARLRRLHRRSLMLAHGVPEWHIWIDENGNDTSSPYPIGAPWQGA